MERQAFPAPDFPDMQFQNLTLEQLQKCAPDFVTQAKRNFQVGVTCIYTGIATLSGVVCHQFGLIADVFFFITLGVMTCIYLVILTTLSIRIEHSPHIQRKAGKLKQNYLLRHLSKTPKSSRMKVSKAIRRCFYDEKWVTCLLYARQMDQKRTEHYCQEIGRIATHLCSDDPKYFCDAMLKTMRDQRGSVKHFFDLIVILGMQQYDKTNKKNLRTTQRLLMEDLFMNR